MYLALSPCFGETKTLAVGEKLTELVLSVTIPDLSRNNGEDEASPQEIKERMSPAEWNNIYKMSQDKALYQNLINSLFPTLHGNEEVKRGVLLMLFGGVPKSTGEGTTLRGDINVCVVGDPSTAKSQFLKQVHISLPLDVCI